MARLIVRRGSASHRLVGDLVVVAAARQVLERALPVRVVVERPRAADENLAGAVELIAVGVQREDALNRVDRDAALQEGLAYPLRSPAREVALVLGVAPGE